MVQDRKLINVRFTGFPDSDACFGSKKDLFEEIENTLKGDFSSENGVTLSIVSQETPSPDNFGIPWYKVDSQGNLDGVYFAVNGVWRRFLKSPSKEITWFYDTSIPDGYVLADGTTPGVPNLTSQFKGSAPNYTYFGAAFIGYS